MNYFSELTESGKADLRSQNGFEFFITHEEHKELLTGNEPNPMNNTIPIRFDTPGMPSNERIVLITYTENSLARFLMIAAITNPIIYLIVQDENTSIVRIMPTEIKQNEK